jgi:hypothetical protein
MDSTIKRKILKIALLTFIVSLISGITVAQSETQFIPSGKPHALIFSDFNYTFNKGGDNKAFELTRAYLGYEYNFSRNISSRITFDIADPGVGGLQMTALVKYALVQYKSDKFSTRFGMIGTDMFSLQESIWGYRYIIKSFQDAYRFGPSADLGAAVEYSPVKIVSIDFSFLNGEGYKRIQIDSVFKATFGITLKPVKGLFLRAYYDVMKNDYAQTSTAFFAGYNIKKLKAGLEYNMQRNNGMINGHDLNGISVYASLGLAEKFTLFTRYDNLNSTVPENASEAWNISKDGQLFVAGFDYNPVKGVKLAPTFTGYLPDDESLYFSTRVGLYFEVRF